MTEDHADMPGMGDQAKKAEPGKTAAPQKEPQTKKPDVPAPAHTGKPLAAPGKS